MGLFVLYDLGGEGGFRNHVVAYESIAFHRADTMTDRVKQFDAEQQGVAREFHHLIRQASEQYFFSFRLGS